MSEAPLSARVVHLEDSPEDAELVLETLRGDGLSVSVIRVEGEADYLAALDRELPDVVLADYSLPQFDGLRALQAVRTRSPDLPFIFVSGSIGEERAIRALREGATDYVLKGNLSRLPATVRRALAEARERAQGREAQAALRRSEERYALSARGSNDGLWDWDLIEDRIYFSPRWKAMLGCEETGIGDQPSEWFDRVHSEDVHRLQEQIRLHREGTVEQLEIEHRLRHRDGTDRWMVCRGAALRGPDGAAIRMAGSLTDITHQRRVAEQLLANAFIDGLTGMSNRALFIDRVDGALRMSRATPGLRFAVLLLDIDKFKRINDSLGHAAGDRVIMEVGRRLGQCVEGSDTVARLGEDAFGVLLAGVRGPGDAAQTAERLRRALAAAIPIGTEDLHVSVSAGIVIGSSSYDSPDDVLRDADTAMFRAKSFGRARCEFYDPTMRDRVVNSLKIEGDLHRALERGELVPYYQPIVDFPGGRISGAEALIRWIHPARGLIPPADFLPVAEDMGFMAELDEWMFLAVAEQLRKWIRAGVKAVPVSINLSAQLLRDRDVHDLCRTILSQHELDPSMLKLEVTESSVMERPERVAETLTKLQELGVRASLDDFGTGYSSLAYLQRFPFTTLKIDRSFVRNLATVPKDRTLARAIIWMAHGLGLRTVAEGIETDDQISILKSLGCDQAQGYFFGKPMPAGKFSDELSRETSRRAARV